MKTNTHNSVYIENYLSLLSESTITILLVFNPFSYCKNIYKLKVSFEHITFKLNIIS